MDHQQASDLFSDYADGTLADEQKAELEKHLHVCIQCRTELEGFRRAVGSLGRLKQSAPASFLPAIQNQIFTRSRGRFFGRRWKLFGRVPFEWVSLVMIVAMLIYYIALLHGAPSGVRAAP
jgi:anti-sigma factor RsiW